MAIKIDKALNKAYLVEQLQAFEKYTLWDQESRTVIDVPAHYEVAPGGLNVVADGTVASSIELASVTPVVTGTTPVVGGIVSTTNAYNVALGGLTVVADGTMTDPLTEIELSTVAANPVDGYTAQVGDIVALVQAYQADTTGLTVVANGYLATVIELSNVSPVLSGYTPNVGDVVALINDTYKTETINVHRYGKLAPWKTGKKYFVGDACIYNNCLYQATADVNGTDLVFPASKFQMVGAASIVKIVNTALPNATSVEGDSLFWLKNNEMDPTDPTKVLHPAGIYTFEKTTGTYSLYREYEKDALEIKSFFETVAPADLGYTGDADKVVNSLYLHSTLENVTKTIQEEIEDLGNVLDNAHYYILNNKAELDAYDLTTLADNTMNIFLVKQDDTIDKYDTIAVPGTYITVEVYNQYVSDYNDGTRATDPATEYKPVYKYAIAGTNPVTYETTLYACVAYDSDEYPKKTRKVEYIGKLAWGAQSIDVLIDKKIFDALHNKNNVTAYKASTDSDALEIVNNGTLATQIELASVTPVISGYTPNVGDIVTTVTAYKTGTTITVVADGTTPLAANELEESTVNAKLVDGETPFSAGAQVDAVNAYEAAASGLTVVADGFKATEIEISNVTPVHTGYVPAVGNKVKLVTEEVYTWKFILSTEVNVDVLKGLNHVEVTYTDPDGVAADVKVDYLTYNGNKIMYHQFENVDINFNTEYTPIVEG